MGNVLSKLEGWLGVKPHYPFPAEFTAAGFKLAADGRTVTAPDGSTAAYDPTTGEITMADGSTVAPHADPSGTNTAVTSPSAPIDLSEIARESKSTIIGGGIGLAVGAAAGMSIAGPIGARVGMAVGALIGGWIGKEVG